jgi:hypothetical protein
MALGRNRLDLKARINSIKRSSLGTGFYPLITVFERDDVNLKELEKFKTHTPFTDSSHKHRQY